VACVKVKYPHADKVCHADYGTEFGSIAGVPATVAFYYFHDSLHWIDITVQSKDFAGVAAALSEKWGAPTESKDTPVQNKAGATFTNKTHKWQRGDSAIEGSLYSSSLKFSSIRFRTDAGIEEMKRRGKDQKKARSKDL
jgi:hypothetical protein